MSADSCAFCESAIPAEAAACPSCEAPRQGEPPLAGTDMHYEAVEHEPAVKPFSEATDEWA